MLILCLYFGIGGFCILEMQKRKIEHYEKGNFNGSDAVGKEIMKDIGFTFNIFPHTRKIPSILNFILTSICFGTIGAIGAIFNVIILGKEKVDKVRNILLIPVQGALIGFIMLGFSYLLPLLITSGDVELKPIFVVIFSLIAGMYHHEFYNWVGEFFKKHDPAK
jgi:hypothetical protein